MGWFTQIIIQLSDLLPYVSCSYLQSRKKSQYCHTDTRTLYISTIEIYRDVFIAFDTLFKSSLSPSNSIGPPALPGPRIWGQRRIYIFFLLLWWILLSFYKLSRRIIRGYCYVTLQHSDYHQARQQRKILNKIFSFILSFQAQNLQKLGQEFETLCVIFCTNLHIEINIRNYDE